MKFTGFSLWINNPLKSIPFYEDTLGFELIKQFKEKNKSIFWLKNVSQNYRIELVKDLEVNTTEYTHNPNDNYWKFSLFVDDIKRVQKQLHQNNYNTGEAYQFEDIGYLMHTIDTEKHQIEFIQKTFKQNSKSVIPNDSYFLKEQPFLGLLTIRTKDPIKSIRFFEEILDLKLLVRMHVNRSNGFTLYFLGNKNLQPPNPDMDAIENREWMYKQSHLFIEIQHYWGNEYKNDFNLNNNKNGLKSINFIGNTKALATQLSKNNIEYIKQNNALIFESIDNHKIIVIQTTV